MVTTQIDKSDYSNFSQIHHYLPKPFSTTPHKYVCVVIVIPLRGFLHTLLLHEEGKWGGVICSFFLFHIIIKKKSAVHVLNYGYLISNTLSSYHK
jgi:hypothetical protein